MSAQMINMMFEDAQLADLELAVDFTNDFVDAYFQMYFTIQMFQEVIAKHTAYQIRLIGCSL